MPKFFVEKQIEQHLFLQGTDVNHIKNVLRKKIGDVLEVCHKQTKRNYLVSIVEIKEDEIICKIEKELSEKKDSNLEITIFQGLPKAEKMEWILQKGTELGVKSIVPVAMKRCVVKLEGKDASKKRERWEKIAEVAAKQCERDSVTEVKAIQTISQIAETIPNFDVVLVAYEKEVENSIKIEIEKLAHLEKQNKTIGILIGPEGGIEEKEIALLQEKGAKIITLGKRILRTETVALVMSSILMYELGDLN